MALDERMYERGIPDCWSGKTERAGDKRQINARNMLAS